MKKLLPLFFLFLVVPVGAQLCTTQPGFQCLPNADFDRIAKDLKELAAARDAITQLTKERVLTDAQIKAAETVIRAANDVIDAKGKIILDQQAIIDIQAKTITLYATLVEKLQAVINKPRSSLDRFLRAIRDLGYIAVGIALGRHL